MLGLEMYLIICFFENHYFHRANIDNAKQYTITYTVCLFDNIG